MRRIRVGLMSFALIAIVIEPQAPRNPGDLVLFEQPSLQGLDICEAPIGQIRLAQGQTKFAPKGLCNEPPEYVVFSFP